MKTIKKILLLSIIIICSIFNESCSVDPCEDIKSCLNDMILLEQKIREGYPEEKISEGSCEKLHQELDDLFRKCKTTLMDQNDYNDINNSINENCYSPPVK